MTLVFDASAAVAALVDTGPTGVWAESMLLDDHLAAPHLMRAEAANILRRAVLAGDLSADAGSLAHRDLVSLPVESYPYPPFAVRAWELHPNVTIYDAWYVALAESLGADLVTLDVRLSRATGVQCGFALPPVC